MQLIVNESLTTCIQRNCILFSSFDTSLTVMLKKVIAKLLIQSQLR